MTLLTLLLTCTIALGTPGPGVWRWPLGPPAPQVVRAFAPPASPWGPGHRGVDLAARPGQPVYAAGAGRVSYARRLAGRGVVAIDHGVLRTTYLPVRASIGVGRQVTAGTRIGVLEGGVLHCRVPCLHWGLLRGSLYLDPLSLVQRQVRLLPYWPKSTASPAPAPEPAHQPDLVLRDATTATGGALTGVLLTLTLAFLWRRTGLRFRLHRRHRPPPGVINLSRERRLRRAR
ncbi:murein hydrolase activator EnvC family protein [Actinomadura decatromicini]|uniref:Peptidoglycan DD-metalloendopeptidase family protein n=1 Tax=Actinomadura decatromicini TaxID=2604572 RepID=A0A5D3FMB0_9ACTN|nr:M23 family metallopeptidase [Actinomadura decatromicini]TYK48315.1 peptidoglycan DD-metalloendopeptidase family protein [Actinomadura decatromicini]